MMRAALTWVPERLFPPAEAVPRECCPTVEECLRGATLLLERTGIDTARLDAECLLAHVLGCARWELALQRGRRLAAEAFARFLPLLQRREGREPLAYLTGTREFWSLPLSVRPGVLVPRPETETLVEAALAAVRRLPAAGRPEGAILDLCTGTGAVAIALARELPEARLIATDVSRRALRVARQNAEMHGVAARIRFLRGDLWRALEGIVPAGTLEAVVANPPYIPTATLAELMPEVQWEPRRALDGGADGLGFHRHIIGGAPRFTRARGFVLLEIGAEQGRQVAALFEASGAFEAPTIIRDPAGRDRVVMARRRDGSHP
jgi:release factor glutamine methyltransferase